LTGNHNYTYSQAEHNAVVAAGWQNEGYAWYALEEGDPYSTSGVELTKKTSSGDGYTGWNESRTSYYYMGNLVRGNFTIDGKVYNFDGVTGVCLGELSDTYNPDSWQVELARRRMNERVVCSTFVTEYSRDILNLTFYAEMRLCVRSHVSDRCVRG